LTKHQEEDAQLLIDQASAVPRRSLRAAETKKPGALFEPGLFHLKMAWR
jgi:hypothetical protein